MHDPLTLQLVLDYGSKVVAGSSVVLAAMHFLVEPIMEIWLPRADHPKAWGFTDKLMGTLRAVSISPQKFKGDS